MAQAARPRRRARSSRRRSAARARRAPRRDGDDRRARSASRGFRRARARPRSGSPAGSQCAPRSGRAGVRGLEAAVGRRARRRSAATTTRASAWCVGWAAIRACSARSSACSGGAGRAALGQHRVDGVLEQAAPLAAGAARGPRRVSAIRRIARFSRRRRCFVGALVGQRECVVAVEQRVAAGAPALGVVRGDASVDDGLEPVRRAARRRTGSRSSSASRIASTRSFGLRARSVVVASPAVRRHTSRTASGRARPAWAGSAGARRWGASSSISRSAAVSSPCARQPRDRQQRRLLGQADARRHRRSCASSSSARPSSLSARAKRLLAAR